MHAVAFPSSSTSADVPATTSPELVVEALPRHYRTIPDFSRLRCVVRQSRRHGLWIFAWSIVGWVGTALAPVLSGTPFLLMLLSPRAMFVALAADSVPLLPSVLLGTLRLSVTDASDYVIGRKLPSEIVPDSAGWRVLVLPSER